MKNNIICEICKNSINIKVDNYAHIEEFTLGKFAKESWFHRTCYNDALNKTRIDKTSQAMMQNIIPLLQRTNAMFDQMGVDKVYELPQTPPTL